jgi:hypothetical protein
VNLVVQQLAFVPLRRRRLLFACRELKLYSFGETFQHLRTRFLSANQHPQTTNNNFESLELHVIALLSTLFLFQNAQNATFEHFLHCFRLSFNCSLPEFGGQSHKIRLLADSKPSRINFYRFLFVRWRSLPKGQTERLFERQKRSNAQRRRFKRC